MCTKLSTGSLRLPDTSFGFREEFDKLFPEETGEEKSVIKSGIEESCQRDKELNQKMKRADDDLKQYEKARETEEKLGILRSR